MWAFIITAALQAGSSLLRGFQDKKAADANSKVMDKEAELQEQQAEYTRDALYEQSSQTGQMGNRYLGTQRTGYAGAGVKTDTGSPLQVQRESQRNIQQDVKRLREQGDNALELGLNIADVTREKAAMTKKYGNNAAFSGGLNAGATLLGGFAQASPYTDLW